MANTFTVTSPAGGRADDVRSLRFRLRTLTVAGTYTTGGDTLTAGQVGLKRIVAVVGGSVAEDSTGATANIAAFKIADGGESVLVRLYESAATGLPLLDKTSAEAPITGQTITALFIGY